MFPKKNRLNLKLEKNQQIFTKGKIIGGRYFVIYYSPTPRKDGEELKLAVVVTTKISKKAVERNQIKRRVYHVLREVVLNRTPDLGINFSQMVLIVKAGVAKLSFEELQKQLLIQLKRLKMNYEISFQTL